MRWLWLDRYTEFVSGTRATAVKNVSAAEEQVFDYYPGYGAMPGSLIVEGIGQTGGLLFAEQFQFQACIVLAKISHVRFHCLARPGDTLTYRVTLEGAGETGARLTGTSHVGDRLQTEVQMFLAVLTEQQGIPALFEPPDWTRMLRDLNIYEVGVTADGQALTFPAWLTKHEQLTDSVPASR